MSRLYIAICVVGLVAASGAFPQTNWPQIQPRPWANRFTMVQLQHTFQNFTNFTGASEVHWTYDFPFLRLQDTTRNMLVYHNGTAKSMCIAITAARKCTCFQLGLTPPRPDWMMSDATLLASHYVQSPAYKPTPSAEATDGEGAWHLAGYLIKDAPDPLPCFNYWFTETDAATASGGMVGAPLRLQAPDQNPGETVRNDFVLYRPVPSFPPDTFTPPPYCTPSPAGLSLEDVLPTLPLQPRAWVRTLSLMAR
eukprot:TRINITY_DN21357_c0_g1_i1.p1 TRINITY_DN21357_c0_g1~~TRINITY_DN21357_c0_g1_i1.p1  ORF type:complete len:252 (+),score=46.50 TRINITY_DN21357_c0_g1_i1:114-869(+)